MTLVDIASQLEEPFPLEDIDLLPKGQVERDGKVLCMAMPYADVRVYEDRLNKLACGEWSTPPPIAIAAGQKLITYVTVVVYGVAHSDVGEAAITSENAGTEAWAQAFKRACSQFGLGRYLYSLEKAWVPYNKQRKQIDLDAQGVKNIVKQMYQKAGVAFPPTLTLVRSAVADQPASGDQQNGNNKTTPRAVETGNGSPPTPTIAALRERAKSLGLDERKFRKAVCNVLSQEGAVVEEFPKQFSTADLWKISNAFDAAAAKQAAGGGR